MGEWAPSVSEGYIGTRHCAGAEGFAGMEGYMCSVGHLVSGLAITNGLNIGVSWEDPKRWLRSRAVAPTLGGLTMKLAPNVE